jgi:Protein of unknown function with HXXEE motif
LSEGASSGFYRLVPLLVFAIAAHNFEEWLTLPHFGELSGAMGQKLGLNMQPKPWPIVQGALVFVTVAPALLLVLGRWSQKTWGAWLICWVASIFLANVFIPHVPAMIIFGGYAPGGLTAVLVNFPLALLVLIKARKDELLTKLQIGLAVLAGILSLPIAIQLAYTVARMFV